VLISEAVVFTMTGSHVMVAADAEPVTASASAIVLIVYLIF